MHDTLTQAGLTEPQAKAYLLLLEQGPLTPPQVANNLALTRSNAYKVLEQLESLNLASRDEKNKKVIYSASDPQALTDLLALERNRVIALEHAVNASLQMLRSKYQQQAGSIEAKTYQGAATIKKLYKQQANLGEPIYFIKSRYDIPAMGYETMSEVRGLAAKSGVQRYAITPDVPEAPSTTNIDKLTRLTRTWVSEDAYDSPVEWSVAGNEVSIFVFQDEISAVRIDNAAIADSLRKIYTLLDDNIRANPAYSTQPHKAKRTI